MVDERQEAYRREAAGPAPPPEGGAPPQQQGGSEEMAEKVMEGMLQLLNSDPGAFFNLVAVVFSELAQSPGAQENPEIAEKLELIVMTITEIVKVLSGQQPQQAQQPPPAGGQPQQAPPPAGPPV